ncbi:hypothetical protein ACFQY4_13150 [Catellatospora bangladeshensis]|uniref:hypothetical protein n=1 Tax=Catellatospora bangladeshensis TaxID=310355 RepID=UPI0036150946
MSSARVVAVSRDAEHRFSKPGTDEIELIAGIGVAGDAHAGVTVQHLSRIAADPTLPNLRQVHLIHAELHDEVRGHGFEVAPGQLGRTSPPAASTCCPCRAAPCCAWARWPRSR